MLSAPLRWRRRSVAVALFASAVLACGGDDAAPQVRDGTAAIDAAAPIDAVDAAPRPPCGDGVCVTSTAGEQSCPDGTRYDLFDLEATCAADGDRTYCCHPWAEPCTYVANTWTLALDPFTCAEPATSPPWMCMFTGEQESCAIAATLGPPLGPDLDAAVTVTAGAGRSLVIEGALAGSDRSFRCAGLASTSFAVPTIRQCETCAGDACVSCEVATHEDCDL